MRACEGMRGRGTARVGKSSQLPCLKEEIWSVLARGCVWQCSLLVPLFAHAGQRRLRQLAAMGMQLSWRCEFSSWWSSSSWTTWIRSSTTTGKPALQRTLVATSLSHFLCHLLCSSALPSTNITSTITLAITTDTQRHLVPNISLLLSSSTLSSTFSFSILASFSVFSGCLMSHLLHDFMWLNPFPKRKNHLIDSQYRSKLSLEVHQPQSQLFCQIPPVTILHTNNTCPAATISTQVRGHTLRHSREKINLVLQKLISHSWGHFIKEMYFFPGTSVVFRDADFAV